MSSTALSFEQALEKTYTDQAVDCKHKLSHSRYQILTVTMMIVGLMAKFPVVAGLSFLEKIPPKFECL
jgi:hypothetical protein